MKRFVIIFAVIAGILNLIEAILVFVASRGEAFLLGMGVAYLLNALFMIGLGWFLQDVDGRIDNFGLRINEERRKTVQDCNQVVENVNRASKANMEQVSGDIARAQESTQKEVALLVEQNRELSAELEACKRRIEELAALVAPSGKKS